MNAALVAVSLGQDVVLGSMASGPGASLGVGPGNSLAVTGLGQGSLLAPMTASQIHTYSSEHSSEKNLDPSLRAGSGESGAADRVEAHQTSSEMGNSREIGNSHAPGAEGMGFRGTVSQGSNLESSSRMGVRGGHLGDPFNMGEELVQASAPGDYQFEQSSSRREMGDDNTKTITGNPGNTPQLSYPLLHTNTYQRPQAAQHRQHNQSSGQNRVLDPSYMQTIASTSLNWGTERAQKTNEQGGQFEGDNMEGFDNNVGNGGKGSREG